MEVRRLPLRTWYGLRPALLRIDVMDRIQRHQILHVNVLLKHQRPEPACRGLAERRSLFGRVRFQENPFLHQLRGKFAQLIRDLVGRHAISTCNCVRQPTEWVAVPSAHHTSKAQPPSAKYEPSVTFRITTSFSNNSNAKCVPLKR